MYVLQNYGDHVRTRWQKTLGCSHSCQGNGSCLFPISLSELIYGLMFGEDKGSSLNPWGFLIASGKAEENGKGKKTEKE